MCLIRCCFVLCVRCLCVMLLFFFCVRLGVLCSVCVVGLCVRCWCVLVCGWLCVSGVRLVLVVLLMVVCGCGGFV